MRLRRTLATLATTGAAATALVVGTPAATAHPVCDGSGYKVTSHNHQFVQVDSVQLVNKRKGTATLSAQVGESHTSTRSFTGTITASVEGGFFSFAKATASASASVTIQKSTTMTRTYTATASVPGHSTRTVQFGFRRYNQYVKHYYLYVKSATACGVKYDHAGWVRAPYQKAFIVS